MSLYERLLSGEAALSLTGLGYVGMPIAVAFSKKVRVIGFDTNQKKIDAYKNGIDPTGEVGNEAVKNCRVEFTADETRLRRSHAGARRSHARSFSGRGSEPHRRTQSYARKHSCF